MVKISAVEYLNTQPFIYGIQNKLEPGSFSLELDNPAACAEKTISGKVDLGLIPVASLLEMKDYHIVSDHCIGAAGPVGSVMLYSEVPLDALETVLLDYQSRTSVLLAKVLAKQYWK